MRWYAYEIYGLRVRADRSLSGVVPGSESLRADVWLNFGGGPPRGLPTGTEPGWVSRPDATPERDEGPPPGHRLATLQAEGGGFYRLELRYAAGATGQFILDGTGSRVWATWSGAASFSDVASSMLGPGLGCVLRLRGVTCLHASVVAMGERALAIVAPKGYGKSTTAAALAQRGQAVLSDDIAALSESGDTFVVHPGYSRLRLWPRALEAVYGGSDGLARVIGAKEKRYLDLTLDDNAANWRFESKPLPLMAVYVLRARGRTTSKVSISPLPRAAGLMDLVAHTYVDYIVPPALRAREFARLGHLVERVALRQVKPPGQLAGLPDLCSLICEDFERLR